MTKDEKQNIAHEHLKLFHENMKNGLTGEDAIYDKPFRSENEILEIYNYNPEPIMKIWSKTHD